MELLGALVDSLSIVRVDDVDETLCLHVEVFQQEEIQVLTTDIPTIERDVIVLSRLQSESNGWHVSHNLAKLELVKNSRLASVVKTHHKNTHLAFASHAL